MMKKSILLFFIAFSFLCSKSVQAQVDSVSPVSPNKIYKVAIMAPLYLDSVFIEGKLASSKVIPKFIMPGIDFVQGAQIALDTLNLGSHMVEAYIYDSKSIKDPVKSLIQNRKLDNMDLIIGSVKDPEYTQLANLALQKNIPFISATFPNEGNVRQNPFVAIINATLKTHCEGIYQFLSNQYASTNIYIVKRKNDNRVDNFFKKYASLPDVPKLKLNTIIVDGSFTPYSIKSKMDTTKPAVIIGASLDEGFATLLANACYSLQKTQEITLIGMPNWDGFRALYAKDTYKDFPIYYTTTHYDEVNGAFTNYLAKRYFSLYRSKPTDMAFKGFETTYYFVNLMLKYNKQMMSHLNEKSFVTTHPYDFKPVKLSADSLIPDYFENNHLYLMEIMNGEVTRFK